MDISHVLISVFLTFIGVILIGVFSRLDIETAKMWAFHRKRVSTEETTETETPPIKFPESQTMTPPSGFVPRWVAHEFSRPPAASDPVITSISHGISPGIRSP